MLLLYAITLEYIDGTKLISMIGGDNAVIFNENVVSMLGDSFYLINL